MGRGDQSGGHGVVMHVVKLLHLFLVREDMLRQRLDEDSAKALTRKQPAAAIGAGGDELQMARLKMASIDRHTRNIGGFGQSRESQSCARSAPARQEIACLSRVSVSWPACDFCIPSLVNGALGTRV